MAEEEQVLLAVSADAWVGLLGAVVGGVIGALASLIGVWMSQRDTRRRESAHAKSVAEAARATIAAEIAVNQRVLKADVDWIRSEGGPRDLAPVERAAVYPCPDFLSIAWEGQIRNLAGAFSAAEILALQEFYTLLRSAHDARDRLHSLRISEKHGDLYQTYVIFDEIAKHVIASTLPAQPARRNVPDKSPQGAGTEEPQSAISASGEKDQRAL